MTTLIAALAVATAAPSFDDAISNKLDDLTFTAKVVSATRSELRKINPDFALGYEAKEVRVLWKEPMMIRLNANQAGENITYIINGTTKTYNVPRIGARGREDVSKSPGKHQTLLDFGLLTRSMKQSFIKGTYVRTEGSLYVFDVNYQFSGDPTRHRVWVDPQRRYITRRMWYNRKGELLATFIYENPVERNGVWVPTRTTVRNAENKVAGVTEYTDVRVNTGLAASNFSV
jgi:outer membrane lipoprotein-sorting protein